MDAFKAGLNHPDLQAAHDYWASRRGDNDVPFQHDIDPLDIQTLLPVINMVDVVGFEGGYRLRHAVVGADLSDRFQSNHVGMWFHDLYTPEHLAEQMPAYVEAIEGRTCTLGLIRLEDAGVDLIRYHRLIMPLSGEHGEIARLFILFAFEDIAGQVAKKRAGLPLHRAGQGSRATEE